MVQKNNINMGFVVALFDTQNVQAILAQVADSIENNKLPPKLESVSGFMRHATSIEIVGNQLRIAAEVPCEMRRATVTNITKMLTATFAQSLMLSAIIDDSEVTVKTTFIVEDPISNRAAVMRVGQYGDDTADLMTNGTIRAPELLVVFIENMAAADTKHRLEHGFVPWNDSIAKLLETINDFIESGNQQKH